MSLYVLDAWKLYVAALTQPELVHSGDSNQRSEDPLQQICQYASFPRRVMHATYVSRITLKL